MIIYSSESNRIVHLSDKEFWRIEIYEVNKRYGVTLKINNNVFLLKSFDTYQEAVEEIESIIDLVPQSTLRIILENDYIQKIQQKFNNEIKNTFIKEKKWVISIK